MKIPTNMKKSLITLSLSLLILAPAFAQSEPVMDIFTTSSLIENQTVATPYKGMMEMQIQHRFSLIENIKDLYGIYGAANSRIALSYGITDRLMAGFGTSKYYKLQDFHWKYAILQQTEDNSMPVSLSYFGNMVIDARPDNSFGPEKDYKFIHRLSYFTQFIVARKFNEKLSLQIAPSAIYFNSVPRYPAENVTIGYKNFNLGLHVGGRYKVSYNHALLLEYNQLLTKQDDLSDDAKPKPSLTFGWEIGTPTHAFQLFATNYSSIVNQYSFLYNQNDFTDGKYLFGFNIIIRF